MQLTKNFNLSEFACKDGTPVPTRYLANAVFLAKQLQKIRDHFGVPVIIVSAFRTQTHNASVGGALNSKHLNCMAADIKVQGVKPKDVQKYILEKMRSGAIAPGGIGSYKSFTHYDFRGTITQWAG